MDRRHFIQTAALALLAGCYTDPKHSPWTKTDPPEDFFIVETQDLSGKKIYCVEWTQYRFGLGCRDSRAEAICWAWEFYHAYEKEKYSNTKHFKR